MADAVETPRRKRHSKGFLAANLVVAAGFVGVLVLFAMLVSRGALSPESRRIAARSMRSQAASRSVRASARTNCVFWNSASVRPKARRSRA